MRMKDDERAMQSLRAVDEIALDPAKYMDQDGFDRLLKSLDVEDVQYELYDASEAEKDHSDTSDNGSDSSDEELED